MLEGDAVGFAGGAAMMGFDCWTIGGSIAGLASFARALFFRGEGTVALLTVSGRDGTAPVQLPE